MGVVLLISGIRFDAGKISAAKKRIYIRTGSLHWAETIGFTPPLLRGRETHTPMGLGFLALYMSLILELYFTGNSEGEGSISGVGFIILIVCFFIASARTLFKGVLAPRRAKKLQNKTLN